jgi:VanZ family protein
MRAIWLIICLLIVYGSVYPFHFASPANTVEAWNGFFSYRHFFTSIGDELGNIALFIPFGWFGILAFDRNGAAPWRFFLVGILGGALALALQIAQIYLPARSPAMADVLWNLIGTLLGLLIGSVGPESSIFRNLGFAKGSQGSLAIMAIWLLAELSPLIPSLDLQQIKNSLKPLFLSQIPAIGPAFFHAGGAVLAGRLMEDRPGRSGLREYIFLLLAVAAGKLVILYQHLDAASFWGLTMGGVVWLALRRRREPYRAHIIAGFLFAAYLAFSFAASEDAEGGGRFNWTPFAELLTSSMLSNLQGLVQRTFFYTGLLWLFWSVANKTFTPLCILLTVCVGFVETAQTWLAGRHGDITDPLLVVLFGFAMKKLGHADANPYLQSHSSVARPVPPIKRTKYSQDLSVKTWAYRTTASALIIAAGIALMLHLPGIPYNVRELFLGNGNFFVLFIFGLAVLWVGAGAAWAGYIANASRRVLVALPVAAFGASIISLILFSASVTQESLDDIAGSNNLYWFVTHKNIWGVWARDLFEILPPTLIGFFERPIRYAALYSSLIVLIALVSCVYEVHGRAFYDMKRWGGLIIGSIFWLWLCKSISFDWSSTDNLNELIARDVAMGMGGGLYLYLLIILISVNANFLARSSSTARLPIVIVATALAIPLGWLLFKLGLEQHILKYNLDYSGPQFLLGQDRTHLLSETELFVRWSAVQFSGTVVIAYGMRLMLDFLALPAMGRDADIPIVKTAEARRRVDGGKTRNARNPPVRLVALSTMGAVILIAVMALIFRGNAPVETRVNEADLPKLPAPAEAPPISFERFHYSHPRLPVPSDADILRLRQQNPDFLKLHRSLAKHGAGKIQSAIISAYVDESDIDLALLHRQLMSLQFTYRGNDETPPLAMAYDWLYDRWSEDQRNELLGKLVTGCEYVIKVIREERLSPYNVYLYNDLLKSLMACSVSLYGDDPRAKPIMNFAYDLWKKRVLPVWRQVMGQNGGWHEGGEYVGNGIGGVLYATVAMWREATGEDLFVSEPSIRGFLDFLVYRKRPDMTDMRWGDAGFFENNVPDKLALALEYHDATAYSLGGCPHALVPSSWPWGPLTDSVLCVPARIAEAPLEKFFDGIGMVIARSDWTEKSTYVTFKAGDNYWSHSHLDQGSFTVYKGGELVIDSGFYGPKYGADHHMNYTYQTIAHNVATITDPDDIVPAPAKNNEKPRPIANDGGQRRVGSGWGVEAAPLDLDEWREKRDYYHTGKIHLYRATDGLVVAVAELTPAYTNGMSGQGMFSHRTRRVEKYWRTFIYDREEDVILIFDRIRSSQADFIKRSLLHTQEKPSLAPYGFNARLAPAAKPGRSGGELQAHVLYPVDPILNIVGGKGEAFLVNGRNYDENGNIWDIWKKKRDAEPGMWRVEISPSIAQTDDEFLIVLKPQLLGAANPTRIERSDEGENSGCVLIGAKRKLRLSFPASAEGATVRIDDKTELDFTVHLRETEKPD